MYLEKQASFFVNLTLSFIYSFIVSSDPVMFGPNPVLVWKKRHVRKVKLLFSKAVLYITTWTLSIFDSHHLNISSLHCLLIFSHNLSSENWYQLKQIITLIVDNVLFFFHHLYAPLWTVFVKRNLILITPNKLSSYNVKFQRKIIPVTKQKTTTCAHLEITIIQSKHLWGVTLN